MAIYLTTSDPQRLIDKFAADTKAGHIKFWKVDGDGDFIHTAGDWADKAYVRPKALTGKLRLSIGYFNNNPGTREVFGIISGRVIEMFIAHLHAYFTGGSFTEDPDSSDSAITG